MISEEAEYRLEQDKRRAFIRTGMASVATLAILGTSSQAQAAESVKKNSNDTH